MSCCNGVRSNPLCLTELANLAEDAAPLHSFSLPSCTEFEVAITPSAKSPRRILRIRHGQAYKPQRSVDGSSFFEYVAQRLQVQRSRQAVWDDDIIKPA